MLASILCLLLQQAQQDDCSDWSNGKRVNYLSDLLWLYVDTEETSRFKAIPFLLYCFCHVCPQDQIIHKVTHDLKKKKKKGNVGLGPTKNRGGATRVSASKQCIQVDICLQIFSIFLFWVMESRRAFFLKALSAGCLMRLLGL